MECEEGLKVRLLLVPVEPPPEPNLEAEAEAGEDAEAGPAPLELLLTDQVHGLPGEAQFLERARGSTFVPSHTGDGMLLVSRVKVPLPPPR